MLASKKRLAHLLTRLIYKLRLAIGLSILTALVVYCLSIAAV